MSSVYEIVTSRIMELLEQGEIPWRKPWRSSGGPRNLISKKPYRGINQFLLNCSPYASPYWLTFRQIQAKNGSLRKGSKSQIVVFWKWVDGKDKDDQENGTDTDTDHSNPGKIPLLRYYNVFNLDQVGGITPPPEDQVTNPFTPIKAAEHIIENMPLKPEIRYGGNRAFYHTAFDYVQLPPRDQFHSPEDLYQTTFHELTHATGHQSRLSRKGVTETSYFGSHEYSQEELVAEFGASMLCGVAGVEQQTIENSAAYIAGWLKVLSRGDKKLAIIAAGQAQRAADFILGRKEADTE